VIPDSLTTGIAHPFASWPIQDVPHRAPGVYTIWDGDALVYVGMAGRSHSTWKEDGKRKGLWNRLNSHAGGRRSGDQFCVYVCDRLVIPDLTSEQMAGLRGGTFSLDAATRTYIRTRLSFRWAVTTDDVAAFSLEEQARRDLKPFLNPKR